MKTELQKRIIIIPPVPSSMSSTMYDYRVAQEALQKEIGKLFMLPRWLMIDRDRTPNKTEALNRSRP